jgi:hypothetical protein
MVRPERSHVDFRSRSMPGLRTSGQQWQAYASYYALIGLPVKPDDWYSNQGRSDYLQRRNSPTFPSI